MIETQRGAAQGASRRRNRRWDAAHSPAACHTACTRELGAAERSLEHLSVRPRRAGGWWIIFEPELHLGEDVLVPDLAGWRRERMPDYPDTAYVSLPPDWVCEVLSASTRRLDLQEKRPVYAREGVGHLWLVDPTDRTLEAFELHEGQWLLIASAKDDDPVSIRPFDAITFSLADLWP